MNCQVSPRGLPLAPREKAEPGADDARVIVLVNEVSIHQKAEAAGPDLDGHAVEVFEVRETPGRFEQGVVVAEGGIARGAAVRIPGDFERARQRAIEVEILLFRPGHVTDVALISRPPGERAPRFMARGGLLSGRLP